jgi:hypothetical protein
MIDWRPNSMTCHQNGLSVVLGDGGSKSIIYILKYVNNSPIVFLFFIVSAQTPLYYVVLRLLIYMMYQVLGVFLAGHVSYRPIFDD